MWRGRSRFRECRSTCCGRGAPGSEDPGLQIVRQSFVFFFPAAFAVGLPLSQLAVHVGVGIAALLVGAGMFALRWIGGGDAKALAAACLWMGLTGLAPLLLWTAIVGGGFCLLLLLVRQYYPMVAPAAFRIGWLARLMEPKGDIPYGVAIAIGALIAFPEGDLVIRFLTAR